MTALSGPMTVHAQANETLDDLVYRTLGRSSGAVEEVLKANPNLADVGLFLPRGRAVVLPAAAAGPVATPMINLWDRP